MFPLEASTECAAIYDLENEGVRYKLELDTLRTWSEAQALCDDLAKPSRGHLATPTTGAQLAFIKGLITPQAVWLGIGRDQDADPRRRDSFRTVTGEVVQDGLWATNEPNNVGDERVVIVASDSLLIDIGHELMHPTVCECDGRASIAFDWE